MPNWNQVLAEIQTESARPSESPLDRVRRRYIKKLYEYRQRNVIAYYSGWLTKGSIGNTEINDNDKNGFMSTVHGLDRSKGLDLILHTPGGQIGATESIVDYLRKMFGGNIEVFVPQIAMSAGTMIALSSLKIHLGKQSNLGPIDPQIGGIPTEGVMLEFKKALQEVKKDPSVIPLWREIVGKYPASFLIQCENAIVWSKSVVKEWMLSGMFKEDIDRDNKVERILNYFSSMEVTSNHNRHIDKDKCKELNVKIFDLEDDQDLQDLILTIHHTYMHSISQSHMIKIIENHEGIAMAWSVMPNK